MDFADFSWLDVADVLPAGALTVGVFGLGVAEAGIVLFELEVGSRPPELEARNELLELTFSFGGVADADRVCSGVADADRVCSGVRGTDSNMPAT